MHGLVCTRLVSEVYIMTLSLLLCVSVGPFLFASSPLGTDLPDCLRTGMTALPCVEVLSRPAGDKFASKVFQEGILLILLSLAVSGHLLSCTDELT
jgi:hypothetical protein